jgi:CRP/FNR family cyclic AMP-dependent transcriptional regulator
MGEDDFAMAAAALDRCGWLDGHGGDLRRRLLAHGTLRVLPAGRWAYAEGDDDSGILVVVRGALQIYAQAPGDRDVLIGQIGHGNAIGQTARFGGGPRLVTAISTAASLVLQVTDAALAAIARDEPLIWQAIASLNYAQLRMMVQLLAETTALPPRQRLAARLARFASDARTGAELPLCQQALGEMVGLSRKTVNACLADLEQRGLVRRRYGAIEVPDAAALQAHAFAMEA